MKNLQCANLISMGIFQQAAHVIGTNEPEQSRFFVPVTVDYGYSLSERYKPSKIAMSSFVYSPTQMHFF